MCEGRSLVGRVARQWSARVRIQWSIHSPLRHACSRFVLCSPGTSFEHLLLFLPEGYVLRSTFSSHSQWVPSAMWSRTSEHLFVSGSYDTLVKLWDTRSLKAPLYDLQGHEDRVLCVDWSVDQLILSGGADNSLKMFSFKWKHLSLFVVFEINKTKNEGISSSRISSAPSFVRFFDREQSVSLAAPTRRFPLVVDRVIAQVHFGCSMTGRWALRQPFPALTRWKKLSECLSQESNLDYTSFSRVSSPLDHRDLRDEKPASLLSLIITKKVTDQTLHASEGRLDATYTRISWWQKRRVFIARNSDGCSRPDFLGSTSFLGIFFGWVRLSLIRLLNLLRPNQKRVLLLARSKCKQDVCNFSISFSPTQVKTMYP